MLRAAATVVALALFGDVVTTSTGIPVPGSAIGLVCLVTFFALRRGPDRGFGTLFESTAPHFPFFFVPAAAGLVAHSETLAQSWLVFTAAIIFGTSVVIVVTGALAQSLLHFSAQRRSA